VVIWRCKSHAPGVKLHRAGFQKGPMDQIHEVQIGI
jgi:hypothetical protein